eukprot:scaffold5216_cov36-Phaeocystis_antarctica.AAC.3
MAEAAGHGTASPRRCNVRRPHLFEKHREPLSRAAASWAEGLVRAISEGQELGDDLRPALLGQSSPHHPAPRATEPPPATRHAGAPPPPAPSRQQRSPRATPPPTAPLALRGYQPTAPLAQSRACACSPARARALARAGRETTWSRPGLAPAGQSRERARQRAPPWGRRYHCPPPAVRDAPPRRATPAAWRAPRRRRRRAGR